MSAPLVALAPLVIARTESGALEYLYRGATVPSTVPADEVKRLKADGAIGTEKQADEPRQGSASAPKPGTGAADPAAAQPSPVPTPTEETEQPAGNASLEAWQTYATSKGATEEQLDGKTRDQLRDQYSQ